MVHSKRNVNIGFLSTKTFERSQHKLDSVCDSNTLTCSFTSRMIPPYKQFCGALRVPDRTYQQTLQVVIVCVLKMRQQIQVVQVLSQTHFVAMNLIAHRSWSTVLLHSLRRAGRNNPLINQTRRD